MRQSHLRPRLLLLHLILLCLSETTLASTFMISNLNLHFNWHGHASAQESNCIMFVNFVWLCSSHSHLHLSSSSQLFQRFTFGALLDDILSCDWEAECVLGLVWPPDVGCFALWNVTEIKQQLQEAVILRQLLEWITRVQSITLYSNYCNQIKEFPKFVVHMFDHLVNVWRDVWWPWGSILLEATKKGKCNYLLQWAI